MKNNSKYKLKLAILSSFIFLAILYIFYYTNYIDFNMIRTNYFPILGVSIIAILLDYILFGEAFLVSSILGLVAGYIVESKNLTLTGEIMSNLILMVGCIVGFISQMHIKSKKK